MPTLRELIERQKKHEESEKAKPFFRFKLDIEEEARQTFKNLITKEVKIEVLAEIAQQLKILIAQGLKGESIKGDQGILGEKGERGDRGERGLMGLKGKDGLDGRDGFSGKDGRDGKDGSIIEGKEIIDKVNSLKISSEFQIDAKHIKNLPTTKLGARDNIVRGGGASVRGPEIPTGTIDGANTTFTTSETPKASSVMLFVNGAFQREGSGQDFTMSGRTITFVVAPQTNSNILCVYRV